MRQSQPIVIKYSEFDPNNIVFSTVKKNKFGGKKVYINYKNPKLGGKAHRFYLQLPEVRAPFGVSEMEKKDQSTGVVTGYSYSMSFSLNRESNKVALCEDKMLAFDERIMAEGVKNCVTWLGRTELVDLINKEIYTATVRPPKVKPGEEPKDYPNTIRANMHKDTKTYKKDESGKPDLKSGKFFAVAFMGSGEYEPVPTGGVDPDTGEPETRQVEIMDEVDIQENVTGGTKVTPIIQCGGVWFGFGGYGVSWTLSQVQVTPDDTLQGYSILPDDEPADTNTTGTSNYEVYEAGQSDGQSETEQEQSGVVQPVQPTIQPEPTKTVSVRLKVKD